MIILITRSEVKVKVTSKRYMTLHHLKMHQHTKCGFPISNNVRDMLWTQLLLYLGQRSRSQWPENGMWHSAIPRCIYTHQIWNSYLKEYKRYAPDMIILKLGQRSSSRSQRHNYGTWHFVIPRCTHTPNSYLKYYKRYAPNTNTLKTRSEVKFTMTCKWYLTLRHLKKVFTHQIWNSYLKEYRRYAPGSMQFLKTRSEVNFKVTVTQLW